MRKIAIIAVVALTLAGLSGCENEQEHQHHLFALQGCVADTDKADEAIVEMDTKYEQKTDPSTDPLLTQRQHDWRAAQCMSVEEKTTIEFQQAKHDDYGKLQFSEAEAREAGTR